MGYYDLILLMQNPMDFAEFQALCEKHGLSQIGGTEFMWRTTTLYTAMRIHPTLTPREALEKFTVARAKIEALSPAPTKSTGSGCGTCGGGKVL